MKKEKSGEGKGFPVNMEDIRDLARLERYNRDWSPAAAAGGEGHGLQPKRMAELFNIQKGMTPESQRLLDIEISQQDQNAVSAKETTERRRGFINKFVANQYDGLLATYLDMKNRRIKEAQGQAATMRGGPVDLAKQQELEEALKNPEIVAELERQIKEKQRT